MFLVPAALLLPCCCLSAAPLSKAAGNGVFLLLLLNVVLFVLDHVLHIKGIQGLYLNHAKPQWYQVCRHTSTHSQQLLASSTLHWDLLAVADGSVCTLACTFSLALCSRDGPSACTLQWLVATAQSLAHVSCSSYALNKSLLIIRAEALF